MSENLTIKTPIVPDGCLELTGHSSLSALPAIFALHHSARYDDKKRMCVVQTDVDGLKTLSSLGSSAASAIGSALAALGDLLVCADGNEIRAQSLNELGWLIMALGELGMDLENARNRIDHNLKEAQSAQAELGGDA